MPFEAAPLIRIGIGAIMKNEAPYILEWIAYHRAIGVDRFFVADNASDDGTSELLKALSAIGIVDYLSFPGRRDQPPQLPAYAQIMRQFGKAVDWIAFIDADEFILPTNGKRSIRPFFTNLRPDVGAVVLNWAVYGSSFREVPSEGLVIERFTRRAGEEFTANLHCKTILRTAAYRRVGSNPHIFRIRADYWISQADGWDLFHHSERGEGLSDRLVWTPLRLNHYVVKSRAEFDRKKAPRGRATMSNTFRDERFFRGHDRNDVFDPVADWLVQATNTGVQELKLHLLASGCQEELISADRQIAALRPISAGIGD